MALDTLILDARGNPFQGSIDAIGGETTVDARVAGATLGAINAELITDINGKTTALFDVRSAAANLTLVFDATLDGTNYFSIPSFVISQQVGAAFASGQFVPQIVITTTAVGVYEVNVSGFRRVRCRVSAYTSGNVVVTARASISDFMIYALPIPSTFHISATAVANTAATATLPAAGVGLFHYITHINIVRNATAALAGTATLIHTTTNLPGSFAWSVGNAMNAGGTQVDVIYEPRQPLKSVLSNTTTTVVAAAGGAAVLGRVNVSYYIGQ